MGRKSRAKAEQNSTKRQFVKFEGEITIPVEIAIPDEIARHFSIEELRRLLHYTLIVSSSMAEAAFISAGCEEEREAAYREDDGGIDGSLLLPLLAIPSMSSFVFTGDEPIELSVALSSDYAADRAGLAYTAGLMTGDIHRFSHLNALSEELTGVIDLPCLPIAHRVIGDGRWRMTGIVEANGDIEEEG